MNVLNCINVSYGVNSDVLCYLIGANICDYDITVVTI